ncbi:hypothetical protein [Bacillus anthracis]|uniref:hypothetical protein n=1 Tax=Bacillus anthracis TaxID=1392 RepID=UPI0015E7EF28|nr:hypothetical protein [Bacillus anthracis]
MNYHNLETLVEDLWDKFDDLVELERNLNKHYHFRRKFIIQMIYKIAKEKTK